jgi:hypothetical protein
VIGHSEKYSDGTSWAYTSRSKAALSAVGKYWAFDSWVSLDNQTVNLKAVTTDLKVKAKFVEKDYTYSINYFNDDNQKVDHPASRNLLWAAAISAPSLKSFQQMDYADPASTPKGFWGYDFLNPTDLKNKKADFYEKSDTTKALLPSSLSFASGATLPVSVSASGTLFALTALNDFCQCNPTYPVYLSNGSSWLSLGNLASSLTISLYASYTRTAHPFNVSFYDKDPSANSDAQVLASLSVPYTQIFTCTISGSQTTISYGTDSHTFDGTAWTSRFVNCATQPKLSGKAVANYQVMADCVYFPA